jgi:hypothetical protein
MFLRHSVKTLLNPSPDPPFKTVQNSKKMLTCVRSDTAKYSSAFDFYCVLRTLEYVRAKLDAYGDQPRIAAIQALAIKHVQGPS